MSHVFNKTWAMVACCLSDAHVCICERKGVTAEKASSVLLGIKNALNPLDYLATLLEGLFPLKWFGLNLSLTI